MHRLNLNGDLDERGSGFGEINGEILKTRTLAKRSMGDTLLSSFSGFSSLSHFLIARLQHSASWPENRPIPLTGLRSFLPLSLMEG